MLILSTQVLQAFYVVVTRKLARPLSPEAAEQAVRDFARLPYGRLRQRLYCLRSDEAFNLGCPSGTR